MVQPRVLVLRAPGANCDQEAEYAFQLAGAQPERLHVNRLRENPNLEVPARTFFFATWDEIWRAAQDDAVSFAQRVRLRMASIHLSQQARQVAETAYLAAGATAVFENNPFERRFRDMHAVSQQAQAQFVIYEVIGRHFLGLPLQSSRFF